MSSAKKLFFVAGERSGDLHASNLIKALKKQESKIEIVGWFGDYSSQAGGLLLRHYREIAIMGFVEVLKGLRKISRYIKECQQQIIDEKVDAVVLVDFGGFNMKIAKFCKQNGIPVHYYIAPKVWAWNTKRAFKIKAVVDYLYCILPFEPEFFKQFNYETEYVGNPVLDAVEEYKSKNEQSNREKLIAVLPGSRKQEVTNMLDLMVSLKGSFTGYEIVVAGVNNLSESIYESARNAGIKVVYDETYSLLSRAEVALVTSGTATLETALFNVPQLVCYKTSKLNFAIASRVIKVDHISLVNLIGGKEVVKELIQENYSKKVVEKELREILENRSVKERILRGYDELRTILTDKNASETTARLILKNLSI